MRTRQTFILHLLADPDEPRALRGLIHVVASGEEQSFADGPALLALLARFLDAQTREGRSKHPSLREEGKEQTQQNSDLYDG